MSGAVFSSKAIDISIPALYDSTRQRLCLSFCGKDKQRINLREIYERKIVARGILFQRAGGWCKVRQGKLCEWFRESSPKGTVVE